MKMKTVMSRISVCGAILGIAIGIWTLSPAPASAAGAMSLAEQQNEAKRLTSLCQNNRTVAQWTQQARGGSMRASYEAAAALAQCFYDNVDPRYPAAQKQQWLQMIQSNKAQAAALQ